MNERKRIGFLGGTFNPIHNGHLMIAEAARAYLALEEVLLIPSGCSYMKANLAIAKASHRLAMTRLAAADNPYFTVSDIELKRPGNTYTAETIAELKGLYPEAKLFFIIGADTLFMMEQWKDPAHIFAEVTVAVAGRLPTPSPASPAENQRAPEQPFEAQIARLQARFRADIQKLPLCNIEISSSEIRTRAGRGQSLRYMVPETVREYIMHHKIYQIS